MISAGSSLTRGHRPTSLPLDPDEYGREQAL